MGPGLIFGFCLIDMVLFNSVCANAKLKYYDLVMLPVLSSFNLYCTRCPIMVGLKVNAKGKQVGSLTYTLRDASVFLQVKWLKCFESSLGREGTHTICM